MNKRTRTALFIACLILFMATAPTIVLYSQGYRFDFETLKVVQTGGLYFKVLPRSAQVYVNDKLKDTTSIFTNALLVENLIPKTYKVEIRKDGYYSWQKTLQVKEKQVTEAKNIVLFPETPNFSAVSSNIEEINSLLSLIETGATSTDKKKIIEASDYEISISFLKEETEHPFGDYEGKVFLTRFSEKIGKVCWLNDYYLIFTLGDKIKIVEIDDRDKLNVVDLAEFKVPEIFWDQKSKKLYVLSEGSLYLFENLLP